MGAAYPELIEQQARIESVLKQEEERFGETLENGMKILDAALGQMKSGDAPMLDGETVFLLYDTYGFPVDLTGDICRERGVAIDHAGFGEAMERQRGQARAAARFKLAAGPSNTPATKPALPATRRWSRTRRLSRCIRKAHRCSGLQRRRRRHRRSEHDAVLFGVGRPGGRQRRARVDQRSACRSIHRR